jgi:hypothetical protein
MKTQLLSILAAGSMLLLANSTFAQNVTVDLSESGALTIKRQPGPQRYSRVVIDIVAGSLTVDYSPTADGQRGQNVYDLTDVRSISALSVGEVIVLVEDTLVADLNIADATIVRMLSFSTAWIVRETSISNGLDPSRMSVSGINFFGNVEITCGHGRDEVQFDDPTGGDIGPVNIFDNLTVNLGQDSDRFRFLVGTVAGDFQLDCGQGNDYVNASQSWSSLVVEGNAYLSGGQGIDSSNDPVVLG